MIQKIEEIKQCKQETIVCIWCGEYHIYFRSAKGRRKIYCSVECKKEYYLKSGKKSEWNKKEKTKATQNGTRYRHAFKTKACERCGEEYKTQNHSKQRFCSLVCAKRDYAELNKTKREIKICRKCGKEFWRPKRKGDFFIFCSRKCAGTGKIGQKNDDSEYLPSGSGRRRAKQYGVEFESIDVRAVFERDLWKCQICGKKTPLERRGTRYSNAPEIDHRIPLSKGGTHKYDNVQCACRKCNKIKSNRNSFGQLPLFNIEKQARL